MAIVLLVEDEPAVLLLAESILQEAGYETITAATLAEAQAIIHSDKKLDLVFTDITLIDEVEAGLQLGQMVRQARDGIPVLYTTARSVTDGMRELFVEPNGYVEKPYTGQQLLNAVSILLNDK